MSMGTTPKLIPVGPGTRITLKFSLYLKDGELIDSTDDRPASCAIGDESLLPGVRTSNVWDAGRSKGSF